MDVCLGFRVTCTATQSTQILAASGVRSQRNLQQILDPTVRLGAGYVDAALRKDLSSSNLCGASCGIAQKRVQDSAGIQGTWR
jgi:hypothetical protein